MIPLHYIIGKLNILLMVFLFSINEHTFAINGIEPSYPSINYTTLNGLPSNETYCVFQDSKGYIWIGTDRGLVKFDGDEFKTYTTSDGLTSNAIVAINEDNHGNLWYTGLNSIQLGYIDTNMVFHEYQHYKILLDSIKINHNYLEGKGKFTDIHFNEIYFSDGNTYLVNNRYGYIILNNKGIQEVNLYFDSNEISTNIFQKKGLSFIYSSLTFSNCDSQNNIVYFNNNLIGKFKKTCSNYIYPSFVKKNDSIYIYDDYDFIITKGESFQYLKMENRCSVFKLDSNLFIYSIYNKYENHARIYLSNSPNINDYKELIYTGTRVSRVEKDENGGVWLSTIKNGIIYFPSFASKQFTIGTPIEMIIPNNNTLIIGEIGELFNYYIDKRTLIKSEIKIPRIDDVPINTRSSFLNTQLFIHDKWDKSIGNMKGYQKFSDSSFYVIQPRDFYDFNKSGLDKSINLRRNNSEIEYNECFYCINRDSCYIGTRNGIYSFFKGERKFLDTNVNNKRIRHIEYLQEKKCLIFSVWGEGIIIQYLDSTRLVISEKNGLLSNVVNDLFRDEFYNLWIGTNNGLNVLTFNENNQAIIKPVLSYSNLLSSPNILQVYSKDSILYLGTDKGFDVIDLKQVNNTSKYNQPLFITNIQINKQDRNSKLEYFDLSYLENNFTIHFKSLAYGISNDLIFRYKLNGLSEDWIITSDHKISFLQLAPGKYSLELEVKNPFGDWVKLEQPLVLAIEAPYWESWWFFLLCICIISLVLSYYISNLKKERDFLKKENVYKEQEKTLSNELSDSRQKALNSQLNPHFIFNSLNSIQHYILTQNTELSSDYLSMFSKLMRFVFENSKKLFIPLEDEIHALKLYLELEQVRHDFDFQFEINCNLNQVKEINTPSLLIQPIVENAIWHGLLPQTSKNKLLKVDFTIEENSLRIEIYDNGVGRNNKLKKTKIKVIKKQKSSGIDLTKQRLHLLQTSRGLPILFDVIDLKDDLENPLGTRVIIKIPNSL